MFTICYIANYSTVCVASDVTFVHDDDDAI